MKEPKITFQVKKDFEQATNDVMDKVRDFFDTHNKHEESVVKPTTAARVQEGFVTVDTGKEVKEVFVGEISVEPATPEVVPLAVLPALGMPTKTLEDAVNEDLALPKKKKKSVKKSKAENYLAGDTPEAPAGAKVSLDLTNLEKE